MWWYALLDELPSNDRHRRRRGSRHPPSVDALIASASNNERILVNDGTGHFTALAGGFSSVDDVTLWLEVGDVNGDGRLDVATAQGETGGTDRLYFGTALTPMDVVPPKLRAVQSVSGPVTAGDKPVVRFAVSDNTTTDEGPRLQKAWVEVTAPSGSTSVTAVFVGGDMFRAVLPAEPAATITYKACAKDRQGNEACSPEKTYTVEQAPASGSYAGSSNDAGTNGDAGSGGAGSDGGTATDAPADSRSDDDGGCAMSRASNQQSFTGLVGLALAGLALRRRRTQARA